MIIKSIEYKFTENGSYSDITFRQGSAFYQETPQRVPAGLLYLTEVTAYIPVLDETKQAYITSLVQQSAIFRLQDASGLYFEVGTDAEPAIFTANKKIGPTPGVAYGWDIKISCLSQHASENASFIS